MYDDDSIYFVSLSIFCQFSRCGAGVDFLKMFVHVDEHGVNERTPWSSLLCGSSVNQSFYSSSRHLVIQFHSAPSNSNNASISSSLSSTSLSSIVPGKSSTSLGFYGRFRFLNSSEFMHFTQLNFQSFTCLKVNPVLRTKRATCV